MTRVHEPLALAALFAAACALDVIWIVNLLALRIIPISETLNLVPSLGPMSGLYLLAAIVYVGIFLLTALIFHGRDCAGAREGVFWFFVCSLVSFAILTLPFVAGFGLMVRS